LSHIFDGREKTKTKKQKKSAKHIRIRLLPEGGCVKSTTTFVVVVSNNYSSVHVSKHYVLKRMPNLDRDTATVVCYHVLDDLEHVSTDGRPWCHVT